ncbi:MULTISPECIES: phosphoribosylformylglycinamidine synthase subunit PurL [Halolamina]|uniref:Phosphoribosylformylglycinamidine synthase subunit PurL n=1 Tax=Halolamina pelagica TaxID=699431 RepID=A0A1I5P6N1_9EURY|nr:MULTISPECIES: phosphoribosylformylglycinamidine synthase subunit PurL [Halolamina]NHX36661.1 phosphoribosylformylglycinamidine synthase subunit PurL [Halolamina sp. R1-12]SFP29742.1 phosphoribosylformylglycinamidine synthase [Halolamina pelagica]
MPLADADHDLVVDELGREPTRAEEHLFENLWSEHCAYRSSRMLLSNFESGGEHVEIGPGDDAAVVRVPGTDTLLTFGIESHNHPSYVDPYDGAATGIGGIVRDTLSMGAYPIALADSLYFGPFDREHSRYLFEGVVEGISDYGNAIGVPTVAGSVAFEESHVGNPLVNVACVGKTTPERLVTAEAQAAGNRLVLLGNATGRDGLGGASFASEDLAEDAETEDRPAVQVGDPYSEKLLIECNEALLDEDLIESARDLGAAGLGGASSELVAKGGFGADIDLEAVHTREPGMNATEILLAESQERMCYEVAPENVERVAEIAERFDLGCSDIGEVTEGNYVCEFEGETVVDAPAAYLADGAPLNDLGRKAPAAPERDLPEFDLAEAFEAVVADPTAASKEWVYRQYDHEVGLRTAVEPGDDAAVLALHGAGDADDEHAIALSSGANPHWTDCDPEAGARAVAVENATNLAAKGATPLAAVDCLNGGNPEDPETYDGFAAAVDGLAGTCADLSVPVVGGNVSLYNDSETGPVAPTPTLAVLGTKSGYDAPAATVSGEGDLVLVEPAEWVAGSGIGSDDPHALGGSLLLSQFGGSDRFPAVPADPGALVDALGRVAGLDSTFATHDVSDGGLAVALAELVTDEAGVDADLAEARALFSEAPGRVVVETTDADALRDAVGDDAAVTELGTATADGALSLSVGEESIVVDAGEIGELRDVLARELD